MHEGIAAYFPETNGPTRRMVACMFTTSPDEHFILDRHPAVDDAFIAAGFSGHGYKFCSVIGRVMADFCLGEEGKWDPPSIRHHNPKSTTRLLTHDGPSPCTCTLPLRLV